LAENKATLDALNIQMGEALQNYRLAKTVKSSTKMMASMNKLVKLPQLEKTMKDMSREMAYAGFLSETLNEGVSGAVDMDDTEELADEAVDQVLLEITGETISQAASVPMARVRGKEREVDDAELNDLFKRVMEEQG
jgi:charged multivesicular body protein 2A